MGIRLTEVVKNLLIINVLMFFGTGLLMGESRAMLGMFYFQSESFLPYQIVTHMFMHQDLTHLFFNMFVVFMFGPVLEATWGARRFLTYYLFTGFGAALVHTIVLYFEVNYFHTAPVNSMVWGASGAVFGLLLGYGVYYPNNIVQLLLPPIPLKAKYFVILLAVIELFLGVSGRQTGVAHFAHLGGALFGLIMIMSWRRSGKF